MLRVTPQIHTPADEPVDQSALDGEAQSVGHMFRSRVASEMLSIREARPGDLLKLLRSIAEANTEPAPSPLQIPCSPRYR